MGKDIHVIVCKYNKETNLYHKLALFRLRRENEMKGYNHDGTTYEIKDPYIEVPVYTFRNYELFDILCDRGAEESCFPHREISYPSLEPELREEVESDKNAEGFFDFSETNFAEIALYLKEHPKVKDYDADWGEDGKDVQYKDNPVKSFYELCYNYAYQADDWFFINDYLSSYKVLYWFDW